MTTYRDIWKKAYGAIPKDSDGISFEIHHVDGNRNNNNLTTANQKTISDEISFGLEGLVSPFFTFTDFAPLTGFSYPGSRFGLGQSLAKSQR